MKKTYISPKALVVEIKAQSILTGSRTENPSEANNMTSGSFGARGASFSGEYIDEE